MSIFGKLFGGRPVVDGISSSIFEDDLPEMEEATPEEMEDEHFFDDVDDEDVPFEDLVKAASEGDREAMLSVGMAYIEGEGAPIDIKKGMGYVIDAAEHGSIEAAGLLYEWARDRINGLGKEDDEVMRFRLLGARAGDLVAQFQLGLCYAQESDQWSLYQQDTNMAHFWFFQGFSEGNAFAAMGYAAGLLIGKVDVVASSRNEYGLINVPEGDALTALTETDPDKISANFNTGIAILQNIASRPNGASIIAGKLLSGFPEGNRDSQQMYSALIKAMEKVRS